MQTEPLTGRLDPITLAVIRNGLQQVCSEMDLTLVRAAFSPVISEALDRSDGTCHATAGELIAQGELGLPVFVGTMRFGTQAAIRPGPETRTFAGGRGAAREARIAPNGPGIRCSEPIDRGMGPVPAVATAT